MFIFQLEIQKIFICCLEYSKYVQQSAILMQLWMKHGLDKGQIWFFYSNYIWSFQKDTYAIILWYVNKEAPFICLLILAKYTLKSSLFRLILLHADYLSAKNCFASLQISCKRVQNVNKTKTKNLSFVFITIVSYISH